MPKQQKRESVNAVPMQLRALPVTTINEVDRSVVVCWSAGAVVRRYDWWNDEYYDESLSLDPLHVDLARLNSGAPLLNTHARKSLEDQIGVVEKAWIENGQGFALVRFSAREDVEPIWQDVMAKIIRNVSVGYAVRTWQIDRTVGEVPIYTAVDWEPSEVSLVPVPADIGAGVRSKADGQPQGQPCRYIELSAAADDASQPETRKESEMPQTQTPAADNSAVIEAARAEAQQAERQRSVDIRASVRAAGLDVALADDLISRGVPAADANAEILRKLAERSELNTQRSHANVQTVRDETETRRAAMQEALIHRCDPSKPLSENGRQYRGLRLADLARECVEAAGGNTRGLTPYEIAGIAMNLGERAAGMHGSSDFSLITASVINRSLRDHYEAAAQTFWPLVTRTTATDFKDKYIVRMGGELKLEKVGEHGEFKYGKLSDAGEKYGIKTYGKIIAVTRQAIVNDDLSAFDRIPRFFANEAADLESDLVWGLITGNPVMADGKTLFHAGHANLGSAAAFSETTLDGLRQLLMLQKNESGKAMNLQGQFLLAPVAQMTAVQKLLASVTAAKSGDVNVFQGAYQPIFEARLDAVSNKSHYLAAGPGRVDTIEIAYLEGQEGLYTETRTGFEVDGIEIKARLDVGVGLGDHRWIAKNVGA